MGGPAEAPGAGGAGLRGGAARGRGGPAEAPRDIARDQPRVHSWRQSHGRALHAAHHGKGRTRGADDLRCQRDPLADGQASPAHSHCGRPRVPRRRRRAPRLRPALGAPRSLTPGRRGRDAAPGLPAPGGWRRGGVRAAARLREALRSCPWLPHRLRSEDLQLGPRLPPRRRGEPGRRRAGRVRPRRRLHGEPRAPLASEERQPGVAEQGPGGRGREAAGPGQAGWLGLSASRRGGAEEFHGSWPGLA
mmetsp:Transcript_10580/g.29846  ORF Transcript_10580/g.29846 Transcript_10580/m.29846 type:complete len:248 (-) Transcript_10580:623-1366(-)